MGSSSPPSEPQPVDVGRLTKPEADAFRYIAEALGARFEGDGAEAEPVVPLGACAAQRAAVTISDPKRARLLDRIPVPMVVADGDDVAFVNRAAVATLGYDTPEVLEAHGGLGALVQGPTGGANGAMAVRTASGATLGARVELAPIEWGFATALLLTIIPVGEPAVAEADEVRALAADRLVALLNANPAPQAIVTATGDVSAWNDAFAALAAHGTAMLRLDDRLSPSDAAHVRNTVALALTADSGQAETAWPVSAGGQAYWITAGAVDGGPLALLVFHKVEAGAPEGAPLVAATEIAVSETRRLCNEASILTVHQHDGPAGRLAPSHAKAVPALRATVLALAAKASIGTVLTLHSADERVALRLLPADHGALDAVRQMERPSRLAREAGLSIAMDGDALVLSA